MSSPSHVSGHPGAWRCRSAGLWSPGTQVFGFRVKSFDTLCWVLKETGTARRAVRDVETCSRLFSASAGAKLWFLLSAHVYSHWRRSCVCLFEGNEQELRGWADAEHQMIGVSAWDAVCQLETHSKDTLSYVIIWMDATESTKSHFLFRKNTWAADCMQKTVLFFTFYLLIRHT